MFINFDYKMSTIILQVCIKMRYLINDLISTTLAVYEAAIQVKSTNLIKSRFKI